MAATRTKPSTELPEIIEKGMLVRFKTGNTGSYHVFDVAPNKDKSIRLYGGDTDPMGRRMFQCGFRDDLQLEDRADVLRKVNRVRS